MNRIPLLLLVLWILLHVEIILCENTGFISIDCGAVESYNDSFGLTWVTDQAFISTGTNRSNIDPGALWHYPQATSLRYFPLPRSKYCYSVPVQADTTYLIRAAFYYGNYDNLNRPPEFGLAVETGASVNISLSGTSATAHEVIVRARRATLSVCLVRFQDTPFISSLELRPLSNTMYTKVLDNCFLHKLVRVNCGVDSSSPQIRYPFDPYDRLWESFDLQTAGVERKYRNKTFLTDSLKDQVPPAVLSSAWVAVNTKLILVKAPSALVSPSRKFYVAFYFAEVQDAEIPQNAVRAFNVFVNDRFFAGPVNLNMETPNSVEGLIKNDLALISIDNFTLVPTEAGGLGPLVNAIEIYSVSIKVKSTTDPRDSQALIALKEAYNLLEWTGDPCLPIPWNWVLCTEEDPPRVHQLNLTRTNLSGSIQPELNQLTALTDLLLNENQLTGSIPDLSKLTHLRRLNLEGNNLSGSIPSWLGRLANLTELRLGGNNFTGTVPTSLIRKEREGNLIYSGPGRHCLCRNESVPCLCLDEGTGHNKRRQILGGVIGGVLSLIVLALLAFAIIRYTRRKPSPVLSRREGSSVGTSGRLLSSRSPSQSSPGIHPQLLFTLKELKVATSNFTRLLGEGRFGPVYYGQLFDGQEVAVKVLDYRETQGLRRFNAEIELISRVRHKNLVKFIGYCREYDRLYLIFEYMAEGTLRDHLFGPQAERKVLNWITRLDIALKAARGLEFVHTHAKVPHGDVKSSNVLLNAQFVAKIGDFGVSELSPGRKSSMSQATRIARKSACYLDPEYYNTKQWTLKSDVYSFGVVLLELICGREPLNESLPRNQRNIVEWVRPASQSPNNVRTITDPNLESVYNTSAIWKVVRIASQCLEARSSDRPTMSQVAQDLMVAIDMEAGIFHGLTDLSSDSSMERSVKLPLNSSRSGHYNHRANRLSSGDFTTDLLESSAELELFSLSLSRNHTLSANRN